MHQSRRTDVPLFLQTVKNIYFSPTSPLLVLSTPDEHYKSFVFTRLFDLNMKTQKLDDILSTIHGFPRCLAANLTMTTSTAGMHLSRRTYVRLFLQTVKYISQSHQSPAGPVYTWKTLQVFRIYKTVIWTWKHISKLPGEKRLRIPSRMNHRRYICIIHGFSTLAANNKL